MTDEQPVDAPPRALPPAAELPADPNWLDRPDKIVTYDGLYGWLVDPDDPYLIELIVDAPTPRLVQ